MAEQERLDTEKLENVAGGAGNIESYRWERVMANVKTGYLAIRNHPSYDDSNIIGRIENGVCFLITEDRKIGEYVWGSYNGTEGWVNKNFTVSLSGGITRC